MGQRELEIAKVLNQKQFADRGRALLILTAANRTQEGFLPHYLIHQTIYKASTEKLITSRYTFEVINPQRGFIYSEELAQHLEELVEAGLLAKVPQHELIATPEAEVWAQAVLGENSEPVLTRLTQHLEIWFLQETQTQQLVLENLHKDAIRYYRERLMNLFDPHL
ncbi:hypothetical protein M1563_01325 [Patescibacteria group bacterium]|nr:hypothetical protein [Patescibacteria group bacterium]MCL5410227.1 hypothetical protein [Patescibacteria group bacterium]